MTDESVRAIKIGDKMPDGTIFAGVSPDSGKAMYVTPADAPLTMKWNAAQQYAAALNINGHQDWRVPSKAELNVIFSNAAAIGGFKARGNDDAVWYWSSTPDAGMRSDINAWNQNFADGKQYNEYKIYASSVRCVRG